MSTQPTNREILESIQKLETTVHVLNRELRTEIHDVIVTMNEFADHTEERFDRIERDASAFKIETQSEFGSIKAQMVTKDYLDSKLADLKADLVLLARKGNMKLSVLIEELVNQHALDQKTANRILALEPFPQA